MSRFVIEIDLGHGGGLTDFGIMDVLETLRDRLDEGLLAELGDVGPDGAGPAVALLDADGLPCGTAQVKQRGHLQVPWWSERSVTAP